MWHWGNARCHSYLSPPYGLRVPFTTVWDHSNGFEPGFPNTSRVITVFLCSSIHLNYPVYRFRAPMSCWFTDSTLEAFSVCHSHFGLVRIPGVLRDTTGPSPSVPPAAQIRPKGVDIFKTPPSLCPKLVRKQNSHLWYPLVSSPWTIICAWSAWIAMDSHGSRSDSGLDVWGPSWAFPLLDWGSLCCPCFFGMKIASTGLWHTHELK